MTSFTSVASRQRPFRRKHRRPLQGNPASDRILRGPDCIASAEFAPMPPSIPGYPGGLIPTAIGMRFLRHHGIYQSDVGL